MEQDQAQEVLLAYGADPEVLEEYDCVPTKARIVHDVVKVRTVCGSRSLKKVYASAERVDDVFRYTEHIANRKGRLSFVPRFIRTRYGDPYVNHPSGLYYMTAWRAGREADLRKEAEFLATAQLLAHWHEATEGCPVGRGGQSADMTVRIQDSLKQLQHHQSRLRNATSQSPFERLFLSCFDELSERGHAAVEQLQRAGLKEADASARQKGLLCHGNVSGQNVVYDGASYALLHYDRAFSASPLNDLALFMHRYLPAYKWDQEILARVVTSYREAWNDESFDDDLLYALLGAPLRSLQVITWYFREAKDWDEEDYIDYLEASLELEEVRESARESIVEDTTVPLAPGALTGRESGQLGTAKQPGSTQSLQPALAGETVRIQDGRTAGGEEGVEIQMQMESDTPKQIDSDRQVVREDVPVLSKGDSVRHQQTTKRHSPHRRRGPSRTASTRRTEPKGPSLWGDIFVTRDDP